MAGWSLTGPGGSTPQQSQWQLTGPDDDETPSGPAYHPGMEMDFNRKPPAGEEGYPLGNPFTDPNTQYDPVAAIAQLGAGAAKYFGMDDTNAAKLGRDIHALPNAMGPLGYEFMPLDSAPRPARAVTAAPPKPQIKSTAMRKAESKLDYMAAEDAGMSLSPGGYDRMVTGIDYKLNKMGLAPDIHPESSAALQYLKQHIDRGGKLDPMSGGPGGTFTGTQPRAPSKQMSLQELETARQIASDATQSAKPADRMRARIITDRFDEFLDNLTPGDIGISAGPNAKEAVELLNRARKRWGEMRRSEDIDGMLERADIKGGQLAGGSVQGLVTEFRQLAVKITKDKREAARWTPEQQKIIKQMASPGSAVNFLRLLSRLSPRHYFSMTGGGVLGLSGAAASGFTGLAPTAIGWGVGEAAYHGAGALMRNKVNTLRGTIGE
jgi:hypothetical protein